MYIIPVYLGYQFRINQVEIKKIYTIYLLNVDPFS